MDDRYLSYFMEIAKQKNISKAATYLFVTQSSLSQFLAKEEEELGVKLFIRDKKGLKLTQAGELYKDACEKMLETRAGLYHSLADLEQSKTGVTKVGITPQWGGIAFANIMPKFLKKYPLTSIKFIEETAHPLLEAISGNEIDLALVALDTDTSIQYPKLKIQNEELLLAVPESFANDKGILLCDDNNIFPTEKLNIFQDCPFILSRERTMIRDITDDMFRAAGFMPKVICEMNNHLASLEMTSNSLGISIIPRCYVMKEYKIKYISIAPHWYWEISIVMRRGYELSQADQYMIQLLQEYYTMEQASLTD